MNDAEFQYVTGQGRPSFPALLAGFEAQSAAAVHTEDCRLDLPYGPGPRQVFDFFTARRRARATLVYFHAGYWQSRDKATFRFIAPAFTRLGLNVALVNYPLCPTVSLGKLLESAHASLDAVATAGNASARQQPLPLILSGHSAGGHIAVELALAQMPVAAAQRPAVAGVVALSGIYDLAPLLATTLNRNLMLDAADADRHSPLHRVQPERARALFGVGGDETTAFLDQSRQMCKAWQQAGNHGVLEIAPGADHFSLLQQFTSPQASLYSTTARFLDEALS
ncbi:alpha/beta hydrolase [Paraburkholderia sp. A3BS-1L]|uniref:alpha/beta hydrolase n=1 Tax=Paraburkholderia sp. A3BS-1L TaxID=3028375 RepID=UPI003DA9154A